MEPRKNWYQRLPNLPSRRPPGEADVTVVVVVAVGEYRPQRVSRVQIDSCCTSGTFIHFPHVHYQHSKVFKIH